MDRCIGKGDGEREGDWKEGERRGVVAMVGKGRWKANCMAAATEMLSSLDVKFCLFCARTNAAPFVTPVTDCFYRNLHGQINLLPR